MMRYKLTIPAICVIMVAAGCGTADNRGASTARQSSAAGNAPWKKFSPPQGQFSLLMPGVPVETVSIEDSAVGPLKDHSFLLKAIQGPYKAGYLLSYVDYPQGKRGVLSDLEFLEAAWQPVEKNNKERLIYKKAIIANPRRGVRNV